MRFANLLIFGLLFIVAQTVSADCARDEETMVVTGDTSPCVNVGYGHKIVQCVTTGVMQSARMLVTSTDFEVDSLYPIPKHAITVHSNYQRFIFGGFGMNKEAKLVFQYYGPWQPSYKFNVTCTW